MTKDVENITNMQNLINNCKEYNVGNRMTVHSSIRNVIEQTYETGSFLEINKLFNTEIYTLDDKPTCGEIIGLLAEYYNLKLYKNEEIFKDF